MRRFVRQYITFSGTERMGLVVLCFAIVVLIVARIVMHLEATVSPNDTMETKLLAMSPTANASDMKTVRLPEHQDKKGNYGAILADTIDINAADSTVLEQLIGIGPVTTHNILRRRVERGRFTSIDQLKEVGNFSTGILNILKKHLKFSASTL